MPSLPRNAPRADVRAGLAAASVALVAFTLYHATLLPGFDFGDTGSLQTTAGSTLVTPRVGYPLYFGIANAWLWIVGGDPARALNLASAVEAALACGIAVLVGVELSGSIAAATAAVLLFAVSYTFWSQAIIAEVYALHIALVALSLLLLLRWERRQTMVRLGLFFAVYAVSFGNHLSMVLLAPGYTLFLLIAASREGTRSGWRSMFAPRIVALAVACALVGASQYIWNLRTLWFQAQAPRSLFEALQIFWFDVTKSDWRDTMVMEVPQSMLRDHAAMYRFDLQQQFGMVAPLLAIAGLTHLALVNRARAALMAGLFAVNVAFAFSYNVGDAHVFYLPSHFILALLIAPGLALAGRQIRPAAHVAAALVIAYAGTRAYRDFPALDRSADARPYDVVNTFTAGLDDRRTILLTDLNWQIANGLSYFAKVHRPAIAHARMPDVLLYAPALVLDNRTIGRAIALTERARAEVNAAYGPILATAPDPGVTVDSFAERLRDLPAGTRYVLCVLKPSRDMRLDRDDLARGLQTLAGSALELPDGDYVAIAGRVGRPPDLLYGSNLPFAQRVQLEGVAVEVRMESWLSSDTIRRMGFGQVIAGRQHALIVERGVSFAAFAPSGRALRTAYAANIFAPQPRYLIRNREPVTP